MSGKISIRMGGSGDLQQALARAINAEQTAEMASATANVFSIQLAESAQYKTEWLSAKSQGAKADCVLDSNGNVSGTDKTDNKQAFIDAINATPNNGVLLIPPGIYYSSPFSVTRNNITIIGYGATIVTHIDSSSPQNGFQLIGNNITLLGFSIQTDTIFNYDTTNKPANMSNGNLIRLGSTNTYYSNALVRDIKVNGAYTGGIDIQRMSNVRIQNNDIQNSLGNGINFANCPQDVWCEGNNIKNTRDDGIVCITDAGLWQGTENLNIRNNHVENGYAKGIGTTGVNSGIIENNWIKNTWTGGIQVFQDTSYTLAKSRNVKVKGNTIINAGKNYGAGQFKTTNSTNNDGIYVYNDTHNIDIEGNHIFSSMRYAVNVGNSARRIKIRNNEIVACGSSGINIGNVADATYTSAYDIVISDNRCTDLGSHGIVIGGTNEAIVTRNKIKSWLDGTRCVYAKNIKNVLFAENVANNNITSVWSANTYFFAGQYILPATSNGHSYKCTVSGVTGSTEPTWNTAGATNTDGTITWTDNGTLLTRGVASAPAYVDAAGTNVGVQNLTDNFLLNS